MNIVDRIAVLLATGLGAGRFPVAPGTIGTLWGLPLAWGLGQIESLPLRVLMILTLLAIGVPLCTRAAQALGKKDPGAVVWDEITTLPLTFFLIPLHDWRVALLGFALHRLFDITKPPPARQLERLPAGLGIMADDCAAGVYSNLALRAALYLLNWN